MKFTFRPGLAVAVLVALAILISLGVWQLQRLEWKRGVIAQMTERLSAAPIAFDDAMSREAAGENMEYQPVFLEGVYAHDLETRVFGTYDGAAGVYVFTPLDAADPATGARRFVYVNRGFAPQDFRDPETRAAGQVEGELRIEGLFRRAERKRGFEKSLAPKDQPQDNLYFIRDPEILAARHSIETPPFYVDSNGRENPAAWPKGGLTRIDIPNRHFEYALTWFGLAAALIGVFLAFSLKRRDA
ncbi:MAG TPA: SURF1 family protein [Parvularculaceae bacterium]|nr:SURF1 family protein [Parvularculaceae bacterium]